MRGFRRAVHELHRRSIWQGLAIYLAGSWVVLQVADQLTESAGLPDWVPPFALVMLLMGLPIVLATTFVQEGLPGGGDARAEGSATREAGAGTSAGAATSPEHAAGEQRAETAPADPAGIGALGTRTAPPPRMAGSRLFTWRNATVGGAAAFGIQVLAIGGYFAMRALGIGPVASLVAQGVLDERDPVVLADFEDRSADGSVGQLVTEALRVDLVASSVVALAPPARVQQVLEMMGRDADATLTPALAREVARRAPFKAVIQGEVTPAGGGYVLTASVVAAETGDILAAFRESASDSEGVIRAVDKLSERIREKAGESLRVIRAGDRLEQVTTTSLDALQKYTEAVRLTNMGRNRPGIGLLEEATQIDTTFAMAYRKLGVAMNNAGGYPRSRRREVATKAYEHRHRLSELERYLTVAWYHANVTADWDAVIQAYQNALRIDPRDLTALNNLADRYQAFDRYEDAAPLLDTALEVLPSVVVYGNAIQNALNLRDTTKARELLERYERDYPQSPGTAYYRLALEINAGDPESIHAAADRLRDFDGASVARQATGVAGGSYADRAAGKWREARQHMREAGAHAEVNGNRVNAAGWSLAQAEHLMWLVQDTAAARAALREILASGMFDAPPPADRPWGRIVSDLAWVGLTSEARTYFARWEAELPESERSPLYDLNRRDAEVWMELGSRDPEAGIRSIRQLQSERRCTRCYRFWLAEVEAQRGNTAEAIALFEKVVEQPDGMLSYPITRVLALERLGPLYEQLGERQKAAAVYAEFAERWKDADPELQSRVRAAALRAQQLVGERSGG